MPSIHSGARIVQHILGELSQTQCVVQLPIEEQTGVARYTRAMEFQLQFAIKLHSQRPLFLLTHCDFLFGWLRGLIRPLDKGIHEQYAGPSLLLIWEIRA